ncbi:MAG TPA: ATP-binding protein [Symbiobacteriaceae bacterium]|nr:ATP-binding protein [Symbiobacteriaceae bacterium]
MEFPITYLEQNLVFTEARETWALYRLQPWHYEHLGHAARLGMLWRLSRLFWDLEECAGQVLVVPRSQLASQHLAHLQRDLRGPLAGAAQAHCREAAVTIGQMSEGNKYEHYLALRMPAVDAPGPFWPGVWREPKRWLEESLRLAPRRLFQHEVEAYLEREEMLFSRLSRLVQATRLEPGESAWLIQRGFWRGIDEPLPRTGWAPDAVALPRADGSVDLAPERSEIRTLAEGEMDLRHPRRVAITQSTAEGDVTGLTSFCYAAALPDELLFPGSEWLFRLEDLPFPVEVCLRWRTAGFEEALAAVRRKRLEIMDQDDHTRRSGEDVPLSLLDAQDQVLALEHDLKQRRFPTVMASICLAVSGRDQRSLQERVSQLKSHLNAFQISLEVPSGDQLNAFLSCLPGGPDRVQDYTHRMPPEVLAGTMFLGTRALGDATGPYIARTGVLRRPVYLDPALPPQVNRSASAAFLGSLGGGKSFTANMLTYLAVAYQGAQALILDPKGERGGWPAMLPELGEHLQVISLGARPEDTGKLDPFIMNRSRSEEELRETGNTAVSLLSFLAGVQTGSREFLALLRAVERVIEQPLPSMGKVVDALEHDPAAADLAAYYRALSRRAYASLIFGLGHERGLSLEERISVLQLHHLAMPPAGKPREEYSLDELISVALMHAITDFATHFTRQQDRGTFRIVLLDEAWALTASSQGRALVARLLRAGRAMNNAVYLVSQNVADLLDETIKNNIGLKFVFRSSDQAEVAKVLQFLNLEADEENVRALRQLDTGQALFQDLQGRVGVITLDPVLPHLARAFDTRPPRGDGP